MVCKAASWRTARAHRKTSGARRVSFTLSALLGIVCAANVFAATSVTPGDDQIVASRGGSTVTLLEIDAKVMELPAAVRNDFLDSPKRIEETISGLLLEKQLAAKASELGLDKGPYWGAQVEQAVTRYMAARARQMEEEQMEVPDFTALAEEKYQANPGKYSSPVKLDLTHILITDRGRTEADAMARAEEARKLALGGRDFPELVAEYTDEKKLGETSSGRLPGVVAGMMVPEFEKVAFELKAPGDISEVIKTRYGYHVIRLDARTEGVRQPFEVVKPAILEELRKQYIEQNKSQVVDGLRSQKIEANPDLVASLRTRYTDGGPLKHRESAEAHASADASH